MEQSDYFAHSANGPGAWHCLNDYLEAVGLVAHDGDEAVPERDEKLHTAGIATCHECIG